MAPTFPKYTSHIKESELNKVAVPLIGTDPVLVTEKIHGACFLIEVDADRKVAFGRRNGYLQPQENFFGYHTLEESLKEKALTLAKGLEPPFVVYGELCGGFYPGMKCSTKPVQHHIYYSPKFEFIVFDVRGSDGQFLDFLEARELVLRAGFRCVTPWATGITLTQLKSLNQRPFGTILWSFVHLSHEWDASKDYG